jgi:hypothetical protein
MVYFREGGGGLMGKSSKSKRRTASELREEAKRLLKMADEMEKKERLKKALRLYHAVESYLRQHPDVEVIPVSILKEVQG